jgi:hypothetical protein
MKRLIVFLLLTASFFSCKEEEFDPTGDLTVKVSLGLNSETSYALFTEAAYLSDEYLPLKQGTIFHNTTISFPDLLPGTYVFEIYPGNALRFTGQVVAGKNVTIEAKL